jgi:hypothetical protein
METPLLTIRRRVLARFGDLLTVRATANGTTTTFIDEDVLVGQPGRFAGREVMFTSGLNAGQTRYVESSSRNNSSLILSRPLPYATAIGDEADITNAFGIGITFRAVTDAINYAIDIARDYALLPTTYDLPDPFAADADGLLIPDTIVGISGVLWLNADKNTWHPVQKAHSRNGNGWSLDKATHRLFIDGYVGSSVHERFIRVTGYTHPTALVNDSDTTGINIEWLVDAATAHLCLDTLLSRQASNEWSSKGLWYSNRADSVRSRLTPVLGPSFERF